MFGPGRLDAGAVNILDRLAIHADFAELIVIGSGALQGGTAVSALQLIHSG